MGQYYRREIRFIKEIKIELENIEIIVNELEKILNEQKEAIPPLTVKAATGSFLAQYYN